MNPFRRGPMKRSPEPRKTVNLSDSVHRQLNMYALSASAAGVGMLALAQPAEGKIVYTPAHHVIDYGARYKLDLNRDGITDFSIRNLLSYCDTDGICSKALRAYPALDGNVLAGTLVDNRANPFPAGVKIGGNKTFRPLVTLEEITSFGTHRYYDFGYWLNVKNRYLGLAFKVRGKIHFGWARMSVSVAKYSISVTLTGFAYETIPNKPIIAGKTKGPDDISVGEPDAVLAMPTPEPATLGLLALGSPALSMWRREESVGERQ